MDIQELNEDFLTAVRKGNIEAAIDALSKGADLHVLTEAGLNALQISMIKNKKDMFEWLLNVEKDGKPIDINHVSDAGNSLIFESLKGENFKNYLEMLIEKGIDTNITDKTGMSPLIYAVSHGLTEHVAILLKDKNIDTNYSIPGTKTTAFLMAATASSGDSGLEIAKLLMESGADISATDINGKNALINALFRTTQFMKGNEKETHNELCKFLINSGIDLDYVAPSGMTAFWMASQAVGATMKLKVDGESIVRPIGREIVELLLEKGVNTDVWHSVGMSGVSSALHPLMMYAGQGENDFAFIQRVIDLGADLHAKDEDGNTPATLGYLNPNARDITLALGGDVNSLYYSKDKQNKLIAAPVLNHIILSKGDNAKELVQEFVNRGAKLSYKDSPELMVEEPILCAIASSAKEVFEIILNSGQIDVNEPIKSFSKSFKSEMSLITLVVMGVLNKQLSEYLSAKDQLQAIVKAKEINDKNGVVSPILGDDGFNMLEQQLKDIENMENSILENSKAIFDSLIKHGANVNILDSNGFTPIFYASQPVYAQWLIDAGADLSIKQNDNSILINTVKNGLSEDLIHFWKNKFNEIDPKEVESLYYQLAFLNISGSYQRDKIKLGIKNFISETTEKDEYSHLDPMNNSVPLSPANYVTPDENQQVVENINYQDEDGNSPILVACANDNAFLVSLYEKLGGDINLANNNGETPLMHAIAIENAKLVSHLIEKGSNLNAKTNEGKTVLEFAEELDNKEILENVKISLGHGIVEGQLTSVKKLKS